jgi:primosomal protein N' (replication factor Y)
MRYVNVIVDLSASEVDRLFTYSVPDGMALQPGHQVAVPFGPRTIDGFVVSLSDETALPPGKLRPVKRLVQPYPVILPEQIALAVWMKDRYLCNLVDALRLMIPAEMRGSRVREKTARRVALAASGEALRAFKESSRAKRQLELIELLERGAIEAAKYPECAQAIRALAEKGIVRVYDAEVRRTPTSLRTEDSADDPILMPEQARAVREIGCAVEAGGGRFLLHGVTGSGKTEVYIRVIRRALELRKAAIVLVPEIALTPQMVRWFRARFGADAAVLHSGLSKGERFDEWRRIRSGEARVVIGARSAIFAPLTDIGVIVVDEEHEHTYQSDKRPRYDAREVAVERARTAGAALILGSATPSIATYMRALPGVKPENRLTLIELTGRVIDRPLPEVEVVDMRNELERGNHSIFSALLQSEMRKCLGDGHQAMLFINRRGYSTFVSCRACGKAVKCPNCDVTMTYHQAEDLLKCHYCGEVARPPRTCPSCGSKYIKYFGSGTQKVEEAARELFPDARVGRLDLDTTARKDAHERILESFRAGETNVLVGTQMIAKGLDFPNVTLVGVVAADMTLNLPDYRSTERTFQLITQVAGRAGRADAPGKVVVQTYDPDHYAIRLAARQDYRAFYNQESKYRRMGLYPPFTVIARIVFTAKVMEDAVRAAEGAEEELNLFIDEIGERKNVVQMRAVDAPIALLRGEARHQVFLKMYFKGDVDRVAAKMRDLAAEPRPGVRAELEVNPVNMI